MILLLINIVINIFIFVSISLLLLFFARFYLLIVTRGQLLPTDVHFSASSLVIQFFVITRDAVVGERRGTTAP